MKPDKPLRDDPNPTDKLLADLFASRTPPIDPERLDAEAHAAWRRVQETFADNREATSSLPARSRLHWAWRPAFALGFTLLLAGLAVAPWDVLPDGWEPGAVVTSSLDSEEEHTVAERILGGAESLPLADLSAMTDRMQRILSEARPRTTDQWQAGLIDALTENEEDDGWSL